MFFVVALYVFLTGLKHFWLMIVIAYFLNWKITFDHGVDSRAILNNPVLILNVIHKEWMCSSEIKGHHLVDE